MRKLLVLVLFLLLVGGTLAYFLFRRKPLPTPLGWKAHVTTLAGDGAPLFRDGAQSTQAEFSDPFGVAVATDGTIYVADAGESNRIRKIAPDGHVTTLAGGSEGFSDGVGPAASFNTPSGLALSVDGDLFVADTGNNRIRKITAQGQVSTIAGDGTAGYIDGPAAQARFNGPIGVAVDSQGSVYVADTYNDRIRLITNDGRVSTVANGFDTPCGIAIMSDGSIIVADTGNDRLSKIAPDGNITTLPSEDLSSPIGLAVSHDDFIYVTELNRSRVVQVAPDGVARVIAESDSGFHQPTGVAIGPHSDRPAELYVADSGNYLVRKLDQTSAVVASNDPAPRLTKEILGQQSLLWPLAPQDRPHEVVATMGEVRGSFDSTDGRDHLHSGIDVFGAYGDEAHVVRPEKVVSPLPNWGFDSLNEGFRIGVVSYIHITVGRDKDGKIFDDPRFLPVKDPQQKLTRVRVKRGTRFRVGDVVGTLNRMYHVHLNIGPPGGEINPLSLSLVGFSDTVPPTIEKDGTQLFDTTGKRLTAKEAGRLLVSGQVRIVVDAYDRTNFNASRRRLGLYKLGYQILKVDGTPAPGFEQPRIDIVFDRLPRDRDATKIAYAADSGITVYGSASTRFLYEVTNTVRDGRAASGVWDTSQLPEGDYILRIIAADYSGNEAQDGRDLPIRVHR
ncbi:MAG TPA: NHL repeat-containing protein [Pyrinomonadaceae bacterium]|nr:NHL repeat-containing protein [Pyrinomonadaceae bacterium]